MSDTVTCPKCNRDVIRDVLDDTQGDCPYCEKFLTPPSTVVEQWQAIRLSGVTNMLEWKTVMDVAERHEFWALIGFLTDESRVVTDQIEALSRALDSGVDPAVDPDVIREQHEQIEQQVKDLRRGKP